MQNRVLILITASFPYGHGESYLENELPFLIKHFGHLIIISNAQDTSFKRNVHSSVELILYPYHPTTLEKIRSITGIFTVAFWQDLFNMIFRHHLTITYSRVASILGAVYSGKKLCQFITRKIAERGLQRNSKIYAYSYWCNNMASGLACLKKKEPSFVCVSRAHGYDVYFERNVINYLPLRNHIFKNLNKIYFVSENGLEYTTQKVGSFSSFNVSRLGVMPIATAIKSPQNNTLNLISCSSVNSIKRIHLVIEALSTINVLSIRWTHIGHGQLFDTIKAYAERLLSSRTNIEFQLIGQLRNQGVLQYYQSNPCDVFINTSSSEGLPVSIIEAMAAKMAVIATNVGGTKEIVKHKFNGLLLPRDPSGEDIANSIELIRYHLDQYKENAYVTWATNFDATTQYEKFVQDLLAAR